MLSYEQHPPYHQRVSAVSSYPARSSDGHGCYRHGNRCSCLVNVRVMTPPDSSLSSDSSPSSMASPTPRQQQQQQQQQHLQQDGLQVVPSGTGYLLSVKSQPQNNLPVKNSQVVMAKTCGHSVYLPCRCQPQHQSVLMTGQLVPHNTPAPPKNSVEILRKPRMQFLQPAASRSRSVVTQRRSVAIPDATAAEFNDDYIVGSRNDSKMVTDAMHRSVICQPKPGITYQEYQQQRSGKPPLGPRKSVIGLQSGVMPNTPPRTPIVMPQPTTTSNLQNYQSQGQHQRYPGTSPIQPVANNAISHRSAMGGISSHSAASPASQSGNFSVPLVTIKLRPDADGRFGFNVKGGTDQQMAVVVSKVAANTPADRAIPRLREGDLLLSINGRDPNTMVHDDVVSTIRNSRNEGSGELVLVVRPQLQVPSLDLQQTASPRTNGFLANRPAADSGIVMSTPPAYRPVQPAAPQAAGDHLASSIDVLRQAFSTSRSNDFVHRFDRLERRNTSMIVSAATAPENMPKNRYRDITPYDETRVKIKSAPSGDYINASHVNMEIPGAGVVNRYICCQGSLPHTCSDFWQMAWEQQSTLVVMLTSLLEQGMVKCHQYWPNVNETCKYDNLQVTCHRENVLASGGIAERQLSLVNTLTKEERHVTQLQYMAWPDHGVPDEPRSFIEFVQRVRALRAGNFEPTIVHCSAGIGRTGVILVVETAMSMIEAGQPVDPVEIVRRLRCQRAMLVQNASQFVFACQAILKVFDDKIVTPTSDASR